MKKTFVLLLSLLLLTACAAPRAGQAAPAQTTPSAGDSPRQHLNIQARQDLSAGFTTVAAEELGGNYGEDITYLDLVDVTLDVDGAPKKLEHAIRDGDITPEEIFAYARLDARDGICTEQFTSKNGLTRFTYAYPQFDLHLTYDVYETPDGNQHLINSVSLCRSGAKTSSVFLSGEDGITDRIDREDWGLSFDVTGATENGVRIVCTQSGGQQFGRLRIWAYRLSNSQGDVALLEDSTEHPGFSQDIRMDGRAEFDLDWTGTYGPLPSGTYALQLLVRDEYDEAGVHPLAVNFTDEQSYVLPVTIP